VCLTTYQPDTKSNRNPIPYNPNPIPNPNPIARNSEHSTKYSHMSYVSILRNSYDTRSVSPERI